MVCYRPTAVVCFSETFENKKLRATFSDDGARCSVQHMPVSQLHFPQAFRSRIVQCLDQAIALCYRFS